MLQQNMGLDMHTLAPAQRRAAMQSLGIFPSDFYQELEMSSPYVDTHDDLSEAPDTISLHSHAFWELLYVQSGSIEYLIGTTRYRIRRGDIILLPPGLSHQPIFSQPFAEPYVRSVVWINAEFLGSLQQRFPQLDFTGRHILRTAGTQWEFLGELFRTGVLEAQSGQPLWQAACVGNTLRLLVLLVRAFEDIGSMASLPEKRELIDEMLLYVEDHLGEKLSLEATARRFLVSESTVSQLFRRRLGVSFYRFVTQRRLIAAKAQILAGESLESTAEAVGFGDYSSFYRAFRQEYGISPTKFREMMQ